MTRGIQIWILFSRHGKLLLIVMFLLLFSRVNTRSTARRWRHRSRIYRGEGIRDANPYLKSIVIKLNLPPAKRISLNDSLKPVFTWGELRRNWILVEATAMAMASARQMAKRLLLLLTIEKRRGRYSLLPMRELGHLKYDKITGSRCQPQFHWNECS